MQESATRTRTIEKGINLHVMEGYRNNVDPSIISHPANCRLIRHNDNVSKLDGCVITLDELKKRIEDWNKKYNM